METLASIACAGLTPDVTVFLDLDPAAAFSRKGGADKSDRLEQEGIEFHSRVYEGYKLIAQKYHERVVCVPADGNVEQVHKSVMDVLEERGIL